MGGIVVGNGTAASAETTVDTNGDLHVRTPQTETNAGFVQLSTEVDSGSITGTRYVLGPNTSEDFRLRVGMDTPMYNQSFEGTVIAFDRASTTQTTFVQAQAGGFLSLNSTSITTASATTVWRTYRTFPILGATQTYFELWIQEANETATNANSEWGIGYAAGASAPTDGVFFRRVSGGQLQIVQNYGGTEVAVNVASPTAGAVNHYVISWNNSDLEFWINDVLYKEAAVSTQQPNGAQSGELPMFARIWFTAGAASAARNIKIGFVNASMGDVLTSKPWGHICAGAGGGAYQVQPGTTSGGTVSRGAAQTGWPNSTTAQTGAAFTTATTSPGYNTLGGYFLTAAVSTMTANADYPIYAYLNPVGTATLPGKTLYITGFRLGELNVIAAPVTLTNLIFGLGVGSTSANTTATEGAAIVAARIVPVGVVTFLAADAVGTTRGGWTLDFASAPLVCPPGTYVHLIMRATVITSVALTIMASATFIGYHE